MRDVRRSIYRDARRATRFTVRGINVALSGTAGALWSMGEKSRSGAGERPVTFHAHYVPRMKEFKIQIRGRVATGRFFRSRRPAAARRSKERSKPASEIPSTAGRRDVKLVARSKCRFEGWNIERRALSDLGRVTRHDSLDARRLLRRHQLALIDARFSMNFARLGFATEFYGHCGNIHQPDFNSLTRYRSGKIPRLVRKWVNARETFSIYENAIFVESNGFL